MKSTSRRDYFACIFFLPFFLFFGFVKGREGERERGQKKERNAFFLLLMFVLCLSEMKTRLLSLITNVVGTYVSTSY